MSGRVPDYERRALAQHWRHVSPEHLRRYQACDLSTPCAACGITLGEHCAQHWFVPPKLPPKVKA